MNRKNANLDYSGNKEGPHGSQWTLGSALHMIGSLGVTTGEVVPGGTV